MRVKFYIYKYMKNKLLCIAFLLFLMVTVKAQQNLFNIPSSEITVKNKLFFQQQFNINENIQSNTNFCYGLGWNMELGFNIAGLQSNQKFTKLNINNSLNGEPLAPLGLITFQKAFDINRLITIGFGTQFGTNFSNQKNAFLLISPT